MTKEFVQSGINEISNQAAAAVVGAFVEVSSPRWNSTDGQEWQGSSVEQSGPAISQIRFRDGRFKVDRVVFDSDRLRVQPGGEVKLRLYGTGKPTGQSSVVSDGGAIPEDQLDGDTSTGTRLLLLLTPVSGFPYQDGHTEDVVQIAGRYQGSWRVTQGADGREQGESLDKRRNAPLDVILARIAEERRQGKRPERDETTKERPFG